MTTYYCDCGQRFVSFHNIEICVAATHPNSCYRGPRFSPLPNPRTTDFTKETDEALVKYARKAYAVSQGFYDKPGRMERKVMTRLADFFVGLLVDRPGENPFHGECDEEQGLWWIYDTDVADRLDLVWDALESARPWLLTELPFATFGEQDL